jgi:hypothetical protein
MWAGGPGAYERLPGERQAALRARLETTMRATTYDPPTGTIRIANERAQAYGANRAGAGSRLTEKRRRGSSTWSPARMMPCCPRRCGARRDGYSAPMPR